MKIIIGISGGIGKVIFNHYTKLDELTIGTYNENKPEFDSLKRVFQVDISDYNQVSDFVEKIKSELNTICLINCAGIVYDSFTHKSDPDKWRKVIDINLTGTFNMIRGLLPYMREQEYGRIINFSSVVAQTGAIGTTAYAASKAGLWGMSKSIAIENANKNILINTINLGYMDAGMTDRIPEDLRIKILEKIPLGTFGPPSEITSTIDFLINSNYITGSAVDVNGGLY